MRTVINLLKFLEKAEKAIKNPYVGRYFMILGTLFGMLYYSPIMAQTPAEDGKIDAAEAYTDIDRVSEAIVPGSGGEVHSLDTTNNKFIAPAALLIAAGGGVELFPNGEQALEKFPAKGTYARHGLIGVINDVNENFLVDPPRVNLVAHLSEEWVPGYDNTSTSVFAQDGYAYLSGLGITNLWNTTRAIAYALFVLVLVVAGFMIMFRHKIGGQLMVTVFNTIPQIIVGLILVTFSFAIVGLVIDIGAVLIRVVAAMLSGEVAPLFIDGPFALMDLMWRPSDSWNIELIAGATLGGGILGLLGTAVFAPLGVIGLIGIILGLALVFIIILASLKVFITLVKAYVMLLVDTVLAPIYLAMSTIPGKKSIGIDWFNRVVKNVLTFVLVFFFVNLGLYLVSAGVDLRFPTGLSTGSLADGTGSLGIVADIVEAFLPIMFFFLAAESPKFLDDFLPQSGGKGAQSAFEGMRKSLSIIPGL